MPAISGLGLAGEEYIHPLARTTACGSTGANRPPPPAKVGGRPPREILWTTDKDRFCAAGRLGHLQLAISTVVVHGVYGYPFMRSTVPKENMTLSGEECLHCLHLGRQPEYNWTPPPVVSKTFFVWPY